MTSVVSLQVDSNDLTDQLTKLFPKCRPRDLNLNPVQDDLDNSIFMMDLNKDRCERDELGQEEDEEDNRSQDNDETSSDEDFNNEEELVIDHTSSGPEGQVIVLQSSKGATYKLRDSRIIEIAGGRELFSQSRSKAVRNKQCSRNNENNSLSVSAERQKRDPWESRNNATSATTREITETVFSTEIHSVKHQRSSNTTAVGLQQQQEQQTCGVSEVVVFDDIGDEAWRKERRNEQQQQQLPSDLFKVCSNTADVESDLEANKLGVRVIGNLPIAEYEGSPKRYAPRQQHQQSNTSHPVLPSAHSLLASPSVYPPRPGFPQRVMPSTSPVEQQQQSHNYHNNTNSSPGSTTTDMNNSSTFDYLYEFSETRKVLEEFFKQTENDCKPANFQEFDDLSYDLKRQAGRGSAYVGLRLAKGIAAIELSEQDSPHKLCSNLIENQNHRDNELVEHENNFLDLSAGSGSTEDLGDTEVGLQVGHSRNFTLSPETTDCDSNCGDLDSEVSLLMMETDLAEAQSMQGNGEGIDQAGVPTQDSLRIYSSMPVLEDGLSSGHASDTDNNNPTVLLMKRQITEIEREILQRNSRKQQQQQQSATAAPTTPGFTVINGGTKIITCDSVSPMHKDLPSSTGGNVTAPLPGKVVCASTVQQPQTYHVGDTDVDVLEPLNVAQSTPPPPAPVPHRGNSTQQQQQTVEAAIKDIRLTLQRTKTLPLKSPVASDEIPEVTSSPIWVPRRRARTSSDCDGSRKCASGEEEEADTDLETDRLLGQQRTEDQGFYDDKLGWKKPKSRTVMPPLSSTTATTCSTSSTTTNINNINNNNINNINNKTIHIPGVVVGGADDEDDDCGVGNNGDSSPTDLTSPCKDNNGVSGVSTASTTGAGVGPASSTKQKKDGSKKKGRNKEVMIHDPTVLIEGVLFRARYLGSTQLVCEGQPTKSTRMMQAEEAVSRIKTEVPNMTYSENNLVQVTTRLKDYGASHVVTSVDTEDCSYDSECEEEQEHDCDSERRRVLRRDQLPLGVGAIGTVFRLVFLGSVEVDDDESSCNKRKKRLKKTMVEEAVTKIKAPEGETQPSTEVDLFISTEKIMVLNTDLKEIMMDHALRTISYIADIGDLVVLMARRRYVPHDVEEPPKIHRAPKMICHVFESEEAQFIAQSIGQAFQVAYMEFLKANGIEDHSFVKEMDYQEVLNSQEIFGDELQMFAKKEMQKEVVVPKAKGEILGVVIVESGWGSMLPTVVIANLAPAGPAARCGQLNIGDQIIAINGVSLVGLPLSTCQNYIKNTKNQTVVKLTVVPCAPVVEVKIKRPDTKYQLGFSVQNGVICSLLRGGIAERGGVRVGHRIIEINNQSVVAVPHEKIVNLLATSVGEILMKTMPTSMFRLLTGQETPLYI